MIITAITLFLFDSDEEMIYNTLQKQKSSQKQLETRGKFIQDR